MTPKYKHLTTIVLASICTGTFIYGIIFWEQKVLFAIAAVLCGFKAIHSILRFIKE